MWPFSKRNRQEQEVIHIKEEHLDEFFQLYDKHCANFPALHSTYCLWKFIHEHYPQTREIGWQIKVKGATRVVLVAPNMKSGVSITLGKTTHPHTGE